MFCVYLRVDDSYWTVSWPPELPRLCQSAGRRSSTVRTQYQILIFHFWIQSQLQFRNWFGGFHGLVIRFAHLCWIRSGHGIQNPSVNSRFHRFADFTLTMC